MTIGPEPMIRTFLTSVLFGTLLTSKQRSIAQFFGSSNQFVLVDRLAGDQLLRGDVMMIVQLAGLQNLGEEIKRKPLIQRADL